jgi:hypothetical protein
VLEEEGEIMKIEKRGRHNFCSETIGVRKGQIRSDRLPHECVWQELEGRIYVTCKSCDAINDVSKHGVQEDGEVRPCFVCLNCNSHYFATLEDWDGRNSYVCDFCGRVVRGKELPEGWKKKVLDCGCCYHYTCPEHKGGPDDHERTGL